MKKRKLRYGMVGGGPGSLVGSGHRRAIVLDDLAELVAGSFSRSYDKTLALGEQLGIPQDRLYRDYHEMAEKEAARDDGIDFVVICNPNYVHFETCKAFIAAGIDISCEKPLTTTLADALELECLAQEAGILFMVTYTYSGHATVRNITEVIKAGEIGQIRTIMGEYPQGWLAEEDISGNKQAEWRTDPAISGRTNALGDIGTHIENTVYRMTGLKINRVLSKMDKIVPTRSLDDNSVVLLEYDNGATGVYWCSQVAIGHDNGLRIRIYGDKGSIFWFQEQSERFTIARLNGSLEEVHRGHKSVYPKATRYERLAAGHTEGWFEALANHYDSFIECLHARQSGTFTPDMIDYPTVAEGVNGLRFVEACLESSANGNVWTDLA